MNGRFSLKTAMMYGAVIVFLTVFLAYPVVEMIHVTFKNSTSGPLSYFQLIVQSPLQRQCLYNSFLIAAVTTILTSIMTFPLAWWFTRYTLPFKAWLQALLLVPMIMPPFVGAIGIKQFFSRYGSVNLFLEKFGLVSLSDPIDWLGGGGFWGIIILGVLHLYPIMFLNLQAAMANVDPALREAAESLGASPWKIFRSITLPLVMPGFFAGATIVFIWSFTDLGTPLIFGYDRVIAVQIFNHLTEIHSNPMGYALVIFTLVLTVVLFLGSKWLVGTRRYEMMARGHTAGAEMKPSAALALCILLCVGLVTFLGLLPHISVVLQSFSGRWFFTVLPERWTIANYGSVFEYPMTVTSIKNSLFLASMSALLDLILGVFIAYLITRKQVPGKHLLDAFAMLPLALPGLVMAFGYVAVFSFPVQPGKDYPAWYWFLNQWVDPTVNPVFLLIISYSVRRLPYIVRAAYAGFQQTSITLEEASLNLGASAWRTIRKITFPLIAANLIAGSILTFSFAMLEVSDSLVLAQKEKFFPVTKAIYMLMGLLNPEAPAVASAMGVLGMILLAATLLLAGRFLGKRLGSLFRV